jgi:hypothetical protein
MNLKSKRIIMLARETFFCWRGFSEATLIEEAKKLLFENENKQKKRSLDNELMIILSANFYKPQTGKCLFRP